MSAAEWMPAIVATITILPTSITAVVQLRKLRGENTAQHAEGQARVSDLTAQVGQVVGSVDQLTGEVRHLSGEVHRNGAEIAVIRDQVDRMSAEEANHE